MNKNEFSRLLEFGRSFFAAADIEKLLPLLLNLVIDQTGAERAIIILYDSNDKELFKAERRKGENSNIHFGSKVSRKIISIVRDSKNIFVSANALEDERLQSPAIEEQTFFKQKLLSVACTPLFHQQMFFGIAYIDNRDEAGVFGHDAGAFLDLFAMLIADALHASMHISLQVREKTTVLAQQNEELLKRIDELEGYDEMVGNSQKIVEIYKTIERIKDRPVNVLILGESGTGKELVAKSLHRKRLQPGAQKPAGKLVTIDISSMSENTVESELFGHEKGAFTGADRKKTGHIQEADNGTLFIDEIGNLSLNIQQKLLRFLDSNSFYRVGGTERIEVKCRIIFATNKDLQKLVEQEKFMHDLYYRLIGGFILDLPPLRERGEDILLIANKILHNCNIAFHENKKGFNVDAKRLLLSYSYPGNVRELQYFVRHAVLHAEKPWIEPQDFPRDLRDGTGWNNQGNESIELNFGSGEDSMHLSFLDDEDVARNFIAGTSRDDGMEKHKRLYENIAVSTKRANALPLAQASKIVTAVFERNMIVQKLIQTGGKVTTSAQILKIDKKTLIEKMKKLSLRRDWYTG